MDTVFIEGLSIDTTIGVYAGEQDALQPVVIDLTLGFENTLPGASGNLADTIDYAAVVAALRTLVAESKCGLLEQLAEDCSSMLQQRFRNARSAVIRIGKPAAARALGCERVGVTIRREFN